MTDAADAKEELAEERMRRAAPDDFADLYWNDLYWNEPEPLGFWATFWAWLFRI